MSPGERRTQVNARLTTTGRQFLDDEAERLTNLTGKRVTPSDVIRAALRYYSSLPASSRKIDK